MRQLLKSVTVQGWVIAVLFVAVSLIAVSGRYTLYTKGPVTYRLDRWTGQTVDVYSLNAPRSEPAPSRPLHAWKPVVIIGTETQIAVSMKWIEGEAWYHIVLEAKGGSMKMQENPKNPKGAPLISTIPIPRTALNGSDNRYEYSIDLKDADGFTLGTIEIPANSMTPIVDTAGGPTISLDSYGRYPIKVTTYDVISSVEVRSTAYTSHHP